MKIYVRINKRMPHQQFFRCGYKFGKAWTTLDVDVATSLRLKAEQMLDVSDTRPEDIPEDAKPAQNTGDPVQQTNPSGTAAQEDAADDGQVNDSDATGDDEADDEAAENSEDKPESVKAQSPASQEKAAPLKSGKRQTASGKNGK